MVQIPKTQDAALALMLATAPLSNATATGAAKAAAVKAGLKALAALSRVWENMSSELILSIQSTVCTPLARYNTATTVVWHTITHCLQLWFGAVRVNLDNKV